MPKLLDLFCAGGSASSGYARAGFAVTGVDIRPQPLYPYEFRQGDVLNVRIPAGAFAAIHASPPCQGYSAHTVSDGRWDRTRGRDEPRLIEPVRELLQATGLPYVIENVVGARAAMHDPILLCGTMFGLPIARHRLIEFGGGVDAELVRRCLPKHPACRGVAKAYAAARGWEYRDMSVTGKGRHAGTSERWAEIMGIEHTMTQHNYREAIPPAYAEWAGWVLRATLAGVDSMARAY